MVPELADQLIWCSSDVRSFRYVGTLTACHVATSLIKVMWILSEERETAQRQEAAETRKKGGVSLCSIVGNSIFFLI